MKVFNPFSLVPAPAFCAADAGANLATKEITSFAMSGLPSEGGIDPSAPEKKLAAAESKFLKPVKLNPEAYAPVLQFKDTSFSGVGAMDRILGMHRHSALFGALYSMSLIMEHPWALIIPLAIEELAIAAGLILAAIVSAAALELAAIPAFILGASSALLGFLVHTENSYQNGLPFRQLKEFLGKAVEGTPASAVMWYDEFLQAARVYVYGYGLYFGGWSENCNERVRLDGRTSYLLKAGTRQTYTLRTMLGTEGLGIIGNYVAALGPKSLRPFLKMAEENSRGVKILERLAEHNVFLPKLAQDIKIRWKPEEGRWTPDNTIACGDELRWLAAQGNRSAIVWASNLFKYTIEDDEKRSLEHFIEELRNLYASASAQSKPRVRVELPKPREIVDAEFEEVPAGKTLRK